MIRLEMNQIRKPAWVLVLCLLLVENPLARPVMSGGSIAEAAFTDQEKGDTAKTGKPGKVIIVYTGDLQGNLGPCG